MFSALRTNLKRTVQQMPGVWSTYQRLKHQVRRFRTALYCIDDLLKVWQHMHWPADQTVYRALSAELLFQYHKLEKGMVMPGQRRLFGTDPVRATMRLMERWERVGLSTDDPIYIGALATVHAYQQHLQRYELLQQAPTRVQVEAFLGGRAASISKCAPSYTTPAPLLTPNRAGALQDEPWAAFSALAMARRSVRDFKPQPVDPALIRQAAQLAALAPSACNRQPCRIRILLDTTRIAGALELQNGNRGFGHKVPLLCVLTADMSGFFDGSERHQPYIDGGLFAMSLMLALTSLGLASCPLNWCVAPGTDRALHSFLRLPAHETVTMLLAVGFPPDGVLVPRSPRRAVEAVVLQE